MKEVDLEAIHAAELDMLKALAELCDKHGIRYAIYCGTLLGAVRHGGFIPWDDDVDIAMPLKDYRRFQKVADELPKRYACSHYDNRRDHFLLWMRVTDEETTYMCPNEASITGVSWGLAIDIYPLIGAAGSSLGIRAQRLLLLTAQRFRRVPYYRACGDGGVVKTVLYRIPFPIRKAISDGLLRLVMHDPEKFERVGTIDAAPFSGKYAWKDWKKMIRLKFEDAEFCAPQNFDKFLHIMYNNYMQLPPVEDRFGHVRDEKGRERIIDPHRSYKEYQREILGL